MKNINYLFDKNGVIVNIPHLKKNTLEYCSNVNFFDFKELNKLINFFFTAEQKFGNNKLIKYEITYTNNLQFADKLTYILLECLMYDQIINRKKSVNIHIRNYKNIIFTEGVLYSCLPYITNVQTFRKKFLFDLSGSHFRSIVNYNEKLSSLSLLMGDLQTFLKFCGLGEEQAINSSEISVELIDNALEHSESDCLLDIDVSKTPYFKPGEDGEFYAVNIAVVNFSEKTLGDGIKAVLNSDNEKSDVFKKLEEIKSLHTAYYNNIYTEKEFFILSTFQNKISSRKGSGKTGGKGLTRLIERLQESSVSDICYVVSNDSCIAFIKEHIRQDKEKWVGFNIQNNFSFSPYIDAIKHSPMRVLGTAYNLTFIFKKGENL